MVETVEFAAGEILTKWNIVGVVSMGPKSCEDQNTDTVFSNLNHADNLSWIRQTISSTTETGTYCYQDRQIQCIQCQTGYKLNNQVCELEFSYEQMSSVHDFIGATGGLR